ncbi:MAG: porin family protein [Alphaproteobacteria bacterium]|nr:porin family protein [Alphaproteobacteria bacterium]
MKKLLTFIVVMAWGAVASVAQAQDKKNYVIGSLGIYAASGGGSVYWDGPEWVVREKDDNYSYREVSSNYSAVGNERDNNKRLGVGYHLNQKLSLEFAYVDFGKIRFETKGGGPDIQYDLLSLDVYDVSAVYYKPLGQKAKLTFRGGINSYQWVDEDGKDVKSEDGDKSSGLGRLLGFGVEFGDIHVELRSYDLTLISSGIKFYSLPAVLSAGYKVRF